MEVEMRKLKVRFEAEKKEIHPQSCFCAEDGRRV